ncbi:unnamed protein product, partial [Iphiclides podalirius]
MSRRRAVNAARSCGRRAAAACARIAPQRQYPATSRRARATSYRRFRGVASARDRVFICRARARAGSAGMGAPWAATG